MHPDEHPRRYPVNARSTVSFLACTLLATQLCAAPLSQVLERKELVVCALADALPYSHDSGDRQGFQVDLARALAAELGVALRVHYTRLHREPRKGECDALITVPVPKNPGRNDDYRVSHAYMAYRPLLIVAAGQPPVTSLAALAPGHIAVQSGSWAHYLLTERKIPLWVRFLTDQERLSAVENGDAAGAIVSNFEYGWYRHRYPDTRLRAASELPLDEDLGFDVAVGLMDADQALVDRVNAALARISEAGVMDTVLARYGIARIEPSSAAR
jgi:polar amino acid transport system substrate-binding protein